MNQLRLYGQFSSFWSNGNVSRGLAYGLARNGIEVELHDADEDSHVTYLNGKVLPKAWGPPTPVGAYVGYPPLLPDAVRFHTFKVGFFIAESSYLPQSWTEPAAAMDLVVVPSRWLAWVFAARGVSKGRIRCVPHGLDPVYEKPGDAREVAGPLRFLHIAGAKDFLHRKGTLKLIDAFVRVFAAPQAPAARLRIRTPLNPTVEEWVQATGHPELFELDFHEGPLHPAAMREYYLPEKPWAAVVQPSRAEAFGIVPCEARALGIPVILTCCTGHAAHLVAGVDTGITTGLDEAASANGIPDGKMPTLEVESIVNALQHFLEWRPAITARAARNVAGYYDQFNWVTVTKDLAAEIKRTSRRSRRSRKLGA